MSIRNKRMMEGINKIIKEELERGNLPSSKEFLWSLNNYLREQNPSRPEFDFRPIRDGSRAMSSEYNEVINAVVDDFETLYENTIDLHNSISKNLSKFETEKNKLEYEVNHLENKLKEMILLYGKSGFLSSVYDVFDDLNKVDVEKSSASVDVAKNEVTISNVKNTSTRIKPEAAVGFQIHEEISRLVETQNITGTPSNALSDHVNEPWQQLISTNETGEIAGYFYIDFVKRQRMNRLSLRLNSIKPTFIRVEFTPDNINWFTLPYYEEGTYVLDTYTFDFPGIDVEQVRILMSKREPDNESLRGSVSSDKRYQYLIGIKSIEMYQLSFAEKAELYSNPLRVEVPNNQNFSISKVSLLTEENIPNGTNIKYSIALPSKNEEPEWKSISPVNRENPDYESLIDFRNITRAPAFNLGIDPSISIAEYEMNQLYANGIRFYKIGEVEDRGIISGTERLYPGRDSWGVKAFEERLGDHESHIPSILDWKKEKSNIKYDYVSIKDGQAGVVLNKKKHEEATSYMFSLGVFNQKGKTVAKAVPASTEPICIYMNGEKLFEGIPSSGDEVSYLFNNGWNEILVLCYTREVESANGVTLDVGFDPRQYGANTYSKAQPMEKVSLFDLRFNVKNNDRTKYAIQDLNGKKGIILNHAVSGLDYDFYFHQVHGDAKNEILLKAELERDRTVTDISPKLMSYRLRFS